MRHPHEQQRHRFVDAEVPGLGRHLPLTGSGFRFDDQVPLRSARVPAIGEHSEQMLREIGMPLESSGDEWANPT